LQFAKPRALGLKVSDEFTVPLCRGHHRQLHQAGNEVIWWENLHIKALEIAKGLWEETRMKTNSIVTQSPPLQTPADPPQSAPPSGREQIIERTQLTGNRMFFLLHQPDLVN